MVNENSKTGPERRRTSHRSDSEGSQEISSDSSDPLDSLSSSDESFVPSSSDGSGSPIASKRPRSSSRRMSKKKENNSKRSISEKNCHNGASSALKRSTSSSSVSQWPNDFSDSESEFGDFFSEESTKTLPESIKAKLQTLLNKVLAKFQPTDAQVDKIKNLNIRLKHVPPNHILSRGSGRQDRKYECSLIKTQFADEEDEIISTNWKRFCEKYGFDMKEDDALFFPNPFTSSDRKLSSQQRRKFCQYLSQNLPRRHPTSVYRRFLLLYLYTKTGRWSTDEENLLAAWYDCVPHKFIFCLVGRIIRRRKQSCYKKLLCLNRNRKSILRTLRRSENEVDEKEDRSNFGYPSWTKDENMWKRIAVEGSLDVQAAKKAYFLDLYPSAQLNVSPEKRVIQREVIERDLVRNLISIGANDWNSVDWVEVGENNHDIGAVAAYAIIRKLTKLYVPPRCWHELRECLENVRKALNMRVSRNSSNKKVRKDPSRLPIKATERMMRPNNEEKENGTPPDSSESES